MMMIVIILIIMINFIDNDNNDHFNPLHSLRLTLLQKHK